MTWYVKNWKRFQHFKDRRPPWIKLYRELLDDPDWHDLDGADAKALVMVWLLASEDNGQLPNIRKLAFRLRTTEIKAEQLLKRLSHWLYQDDIKPISPQHQDATPETETETETETYSLETEGGAKKRAVRLDDDWWPSPEDLTYAQGKGLSGAEISVEAEKFRNHWTSKGGRDAAKLNWHRTWENWVLTAVERRGKANGHHRGQGESLGDRADRLADEARALERAAGIGRADDTFGSH